MNWEGFVATLIAGIVSGLAIASFIVGSETITWLFMLIEWGLIAVQFIILLIVLRKGKRIK